MGFTISRWQESSNLMITRSGSSDLAESDAAMEARWLDSYAEAHCA